MTVSKLTATKAAVNEVRTVSSVPTGIDCGATCTHMFDSGTLVTLTAVPAQDSTFTGWSGGGCTGTGTCVFTINKATAVKATFAGPVQLTVGRQIRKVDQVP